MNTTINQNNIITSGEAIEIITTSAQTLMNNPDLAEQLPAICLRGAPGVGKSTIVKNIAKKLGIGFVDVRLAQMERVDLCGLPSTENNTTHWNVPEFWPRDPESAGIIFFDEITSAPSDCQVAAYSIILDRSIPNSDYHLPAKWYIVAAGNRAIDKAVVKTMSSALANRFMHFEVEANVEDWRNWATANDIHPSVTGYVNYRPNNLFNMKGQNLECGWPSPRSWERVSHVIPMFKNNEDVLRKAVYGLIGPVVGTEFMEFHRLNSRFDDVLEMMMNPEAPIKIPEQADRKFALCSCVSYLLWNGKDAEETKKRIDGFYRIALKLTPDFATLLAKTVIQGNSRVSKLEAINMILKNENFLKFKEKFGDGLTKQYSLK